MWLYKKPFLFFSEKNNRLYGKLSPLSPLYNSIRIICKFEKKTIMCHYTILMICSTTPLIKCLNTLLLMCPLHNWWCTTTQLMMYHYTTDDVSLYSWWCVTTQLNWWYIHPHNDVIMFNHKLALGYTARELLKWYLTWLVAPSPYSVEITLQWRKQNICFNQ